VGPRGACNTNNAKGFCGKADQKTVDIFADQLFLDRELTAATRFVVKTTGTCEMGVFLERTGFAGLIRCVRDSTCGEFADLVEHTNEFLLVLRKAESVPRKPQWTAKQNSDIFLHCAFKKIGPYSNSAIDRLPLGHGDR
jgi:hypothetical protein